MNTRAEILSLLNGVKPPSPPVFSGLIHITTEGLAVEGLSLHEVHHDAGKMAKAAASTFNSAGMPSATLPLDLCAPAEALGAVLNYYEGKDGTFPQVTRPLFNSSSFLNEGYFKSADFAGRGRIPLICKAIRLLRDDIGENVVISGMIPGPYTLLLYLIEPGGLFTEMKRQPDLVLQALLQLSSLLGNIGIAYRDSGADYITIHEMGGSPGFIGPAKFEQFVLPALKDLHAKLPAPRVLSVCGNTNQSMQALARSGADAISVDQLNDLGASRTSLKGVMLFGNLNPVQSLWQGSDSDIREAVRKSKEAGVDAVWPGCDLVPQTPIQNIKFFID